MAVDSEGRPADEVDARSNMMLAYLMERPEIALVTLGALCEKFEARTEPVSRLSRPRLSLVVSDRARAPRSS